ncbi:MAG: copper homeostasis protein CutC [Lachnospiraceae bacterium]|nr:copper homeostasis protein CutC [Lachnospiraceae bacterium]
MRSKREKSYIAEICCGGFYDARQAALGGAERIELNSALMLGGLTPTVSTLDLIKEQFPGLRVVAMVRPRGAGFCYGEEEFWAMERECQSLLEHGADGIAFGCLREDATLDEEKNQRLVERIQKRGREAVFHRAFDCCKDPYLAMEQLIHMGVNRVLTSGLRPTALQGMALIGELQERFGSRIDILAGSGINANNVCELIEKTGIRQVHSSCKAWKLDPTTVRGDVSFCMAPGRSECQYDVVSKELVQGLVEKVAAFDKKEEGI